MIGFKCVRCDKSYGLDIGDQGLQGCLNCSQEGRPANLSTVYDFSGIKVSKLASTFASRPYNMWRYFELLPAASINEVVTLNEGCTPLTRLPPLEKKYGIGKLSVKEEYRNPTGSYKDRLASCVITNAVQVGAETVVASSTGNHGASTVAYASKVNKSCIVLTLHSVPSAMKVLMQVYGAFLAECRPAEDRWRLIKWGIQVENWYPTSNFINSPIGSNPYGVDGYKTIACEICEYFTGILQVL